MTQEELDQKAKEAGDKLKGEVKTIAKEAAETAVSEVKTAAETAKTDAGEAKADAKKALDTIDEMAVAIKRIGTGFGGDPTQDGGVGTMRKALEDNADKLKSFKDSGHGRREVVISDIKATITSANVTAAGAAGVIAPQRLPGIITPPDRPQHVRDFIATSTTTSNQIVYVRESSITDNTAVTGEGQLKPNSTLSMETKIAPVVKIANYFKVSEEMLADIPALLGYITNRGTSKMLLVEDAQLMNGSGTGLNINGIRTQATAFTGGNLRVATPNNFDVLRAGISQIRQLEYQANAIMMNPEDVAQMELTKDSEGRYLLPALLSGQGMSISGVRIIDNTIMAPGTFLLGDFAMGAQVFFREGISIRVYDQNEDDAIRNLVTIVIEERLALCVYRPDVFVKGTFSTAITAITKA